MRKIPSLYERDYVTGKLKTDQVTPGCEWVLTGEGVPTQKFDGSACRLDTDGRWWKRYDAKHNKTPPPDFVSAQDHDPFTGHWPGWVPVTDRDKWHWEAINNKPGEALTPGTYELVGPKVNKNPERAPCHLMLRHGSVRLPDYGRTLDKVMLMFSTHDIEGVVWHHPDGRMCKLKKRDLGLQREAT